MLKLLKLKVQLLKINNRSLGFIGIHKPKMVNWKFKQWSNYSKLWNWFNSIPNINNKNTEND